uniref:Uncharacterized protein n=1 Tax=Sarcophilus harrisii TaxID=9305 RepID=A0A7N4PTT8_SARHA
GTDTQYFGAGSRLIVL